MSKLISIQKFKTLIIEDMYASYYMYSLYFYYIVSNEKAENALSIYFGLCTAF